MRPKQLSGSVQAAILVQASGNLPGTVQTCTADPALCRGLEQETQTIIVTTSRTFCSVPLIVAEPDRQNKDQAEAAKIAVTADVA